MELDSFEMYLHDRKKCCTVNGETSKKTNLNCAVVTRIVSRSTAIFNSINDLPTARPDARRGLGGPPNKLIRQKNEHKNATFCSNFGI